MLLALWWGAPLVPSKPQVARRMIELLQLKPGERFYDLGSGDGQLLILASRQGAMSIGIEMNPYVWLLSYIRVFLSGYLTRTQIIFGNYWHVHLKSADAVVIYALPTVMSKVADKFKKECKKGTRIVSNSFQIPGLILVKEEKVGADRIFLYRI